MSEKEPQPSFGTPKEKEMAYAEKPAQDFRVELDRGAAEWSEFAEDEAFSEVDRIAAKAAQRELEYRSKEVSKLAENAIETAGKSYDARQADIERAIQVIQDMDRSRGLRSTVRRNLRSATGIGMDLNDAHRLLRSEGIDSSPKGLARLKAERTVDPNSKAA